MDEVQTVLFVCSGNFYRSRFAEALFNHGAMVRRLDWRAESRGFTPHQATADLSPHTLAALELRNIPPALTRRKPARLERADLVHAALTICLKEAEHRPLMRERHPDYEDRVSYWQVHDIDREEPASALAGLEGLVLSQLDALHRQRQTFRSPRQRLVPAADRRALALEF